LIHFWRSHRFGHPRYLLLNARAPMRHGLILSKQEQEATCISIASLRFGPMGSSAGRLPARARLGSSTRIPLLSRASSPLHLLGAQQNALAQVPKAAQIQRQSMQSLQTLAQPFFRIRKTGRCRGQTYGSRMVCSLQSLLSVQGWRKQSPLLRLHQPRSSGQKGMSLNHSFLRTMTDAKCCYCPTYPPLCLRLDLRGVCCKGLSEPWNGMTLEAKKFPNWYRAKKRTMTKTCGPKLEQTFPLASMQNC